MHKLSHPETKAITRKVRSLMTQDLARGVSGSVLCHNCGRVKPLAGTVYHSHYRLCNDCALSYELAKANGDVQNAEDFILTE